MDNENKKYRLVLPVNPNDAIDFYGGRTVASPLAFYYYLKKKGKVVWGNSIDKMSRHPELGIPKLREIAEKSDEVLISDLNLNKEGMDVSKYGYIYQPFDPAMDSVSGIAWQFKIDRFITPKGKKAWANYHLPAGKIGEGECKKCWHWGNPPNPSGLWTLF